MSRLLITRFAELTVYAVACATITMAAIWAYRPATIEPPGGQPPDHEGGAFNTASADATSPSEAWSSDDFELALWREPEQTTRVEQQPTVPPPPPLRPPAIELLGVAQHAIAEERRALVRIQASDSITTLAKGAEIDGWSVHSVDADGLTLTRGDRSLRLVLDRGDGRRG